MQITLRLTKSLSLLNNGKKDAILSLKNSCDMAEAIDHLDEEMPGMKAALLTENLSIEDSINIYVNGENIRYREGTLTLLSDGDLISIIPAAAAG